MNIGLALGLSEVIPGVWRAQSPSGDEDKVLWTIIEFAKQLSPPNPTQRRIDVETLLPRESHEAPRNSLSGKYGLGRFPLHTDQAHSPIPPRFLLLGAVDVSPGSAKTVLCPTPEFSAEDLDEIALGIFTVSNGRKSFLASICARDRPFVRFDPVCMSPVDAVSSHSQALFLKLLNEDKRSITFSWSDGDVLIIDNWKVLHGRGAVEDPDDGRELMRCYVLGSA